MRVDKLAKAFASPAGNPIQVLREVSFSVSAGETVAIMGASGAGKSTLLHLLGGLENPDSGTISFNQHTQAAPRTSFVFQFHYLLPDLTALENVALPLMIERLQTQEVHERALETLKAVGLGERLDHRVGYLSGGEQQRVAAARALVTRPFLVLADEPTGNLDASIAEEIGELFANYCRQEQAIVLIATHNERLAQMCDRILTLENGSIREG